MLAVLVDKLSGFLQHHHVSFSNAILILLTVGGEQIFRLGDFKCPCTHPQAWYYAFIFFFVPAVVLAVMGWAVSNMTWRVLHGCCNRSQGKENGLKKVTICCGTVFARSAVVPVAWLFLMFLDGNFYACMRSGKPCETSSAEYALLKSQSHMIGWCLLLVSVVLSFIVISIVRCCDTVTYNQNKYLVAYREAEEKEFIEQSEAHSKELAKKYVSRFIKYSPLRKEDWDEVSVAPELAYSFHPLSPLHKWTMVRDQINPQQLEQVHTV